MAEDWDSVAEEVAQAISSLGQEPEGHACCLRQRQDAVIDPSDPDGDFSDPLAPSYNFKTVYALEGSRKNYDQNSGVLIVENMIKIGATGPVPAKKDQIAIGIKAGEQTSETKWIEIEEVETYSPGGVALYHDLKVIR